MNQLYPIVNPHFHLHLTANDCSLFYIIKDTEKNKSSLGLKEFQQWKIAPLMARYLLLCDGKRTHEEITKQLNLPFALLANNGAKYLSEATQVITFSTDIQSCQSELFVTGSFNSYNPLHVSLEITDYCNFRCKHCYVSACPEKLAKREYEDTISLLDLLWNQGVKVIELTGGECTTHPQFKEILAHACNTFNLVAVVSNGYIIGANEELAEYIASFDNVAVQISIDGLEEYHDTFRGVKGAFNHAVKAVSSLKKYKCITRVATTITEENINELDQIFHLCKNLSVDSLAVSTVSTFGRGADSCSYEKDALLKQQIHDTLVPYQGDPLFKANELTIEAVLYNREVNCGAGWRTFAVNGASGDVRICLFLNQCGVIGNMDKDDYQAIFTKEKLNIFRKAPSPSPLLETCRECPYKQECNGCMARAINIASTLYPQCPWIKAYKIPLSTLERY